MTDQIELSRGEKFRRRMAERLTDSVPAPEKINISGDIRGREIVFAGGALDTNIVDFIKALFMGGATRVRVSAHRGDDASETRCNIQVHQDTRSIGAVETIPLSRVESRIARALEANAMSVVITPARPM